jgi:hypothetical protein
MPKFLHRSSSKRRSIASLCALSVAIVGLAGCGGGGGGSVAPTTIALQGVVTNSDGTPAVGDVAKFDNSNSITALTNAQGEYTLQVAASQVSDSSTVWIYSPDGQKVDVDTVTVGTGAANGVTVNTPAPVSSSTPSAPPPPPLLPVSTPLPPPPPV